MTQAAHDIIVVGAGHNSLVAAAYLARCGQKVLVLEKNAYPGGGAVSREATIPGFTHDTHATGAVLLQASPLIIQDELGLLSDYGLKFINPPNNEMIIFSDGDSLVWYRNLDQACQEIAKFSMKDAQTYRETVNFVLSVMPMVGMSMARPPVSFGGFLSLLEKAPFGSELIISMMKSSYDIIMERFEHPKVQIALLKRSMVSACGPEERGAGLNILFMMAAIHTLPLACIQGGTHNLTNATIRCLEAHGGEVRVNAPVKRIINNNGVAKSLELDDGSVIAAKKAVLASIHPHLLGKMVNDLDPGLVRRAARTTPSQMATVTIHAALDEKVKWKVGNEPDQCGLVNMVDATDVETFRRMYDCARWGELSKTFASSVVLQTNLDPSRAPPGKHTMSSFNFVGYNLKEGGASRWDEIKQSYGEWVIDKINEFAPNLKRSILGLTIESPLDHARHSPSFTAGDVMGLGSYIHQFMGMRPTPDLSQYRVPGAAGLYLTGPFMHPGGGLTGGGRAAAIRMMEDLKIDYGKVCRV